ncbi:MAG: type II toxin-antitoxin system RelE/ParE family toxin [Eubacteriales bacterium]|nr:type II toxin-antitoxin system RelE/ParE family toxin [Eubacteriales bacterium]
MNYINRLPLDEKIDGLDVLQQMQYGNFDSIYTKSWEGNIKEAYFYKHNRIFYFIADGENIYLLHACRKQKNKTEKRDADIVRKRAKELQAFLKSGK